MGVASPSISASIANVVDQDALGTASATQQLVVQIATVAGIQISQTVQGSVLGAHPGELLFSFHIAFIVGGCVALVGVLCALGLRSTKRHGRDGNDEDGGDRRGRSDRVGREGRGARRALLGDIA
jgi:hypothetical protein